MKSADSSLILLEGVSRLGIGDKNYARKIENSPIQVQVLHHWEYTVLQINIEYTVNL